MRKIFYILIITVFLNFFMLSFGYSQNGVNVMGVVPETDLNRNSSNQTKIKIQSVQPVYKENKYLYYFEKGLGLTDDNVSAEYPLAQTKHDLVASKLLLWAILLILAALLWTILSFIDKFLFDKKSKRKFKRVH